MRSRLRSLVLLAALAPACWSGFSEIRIAGADAGAPGDRPASDRPLVDASRTPDAAETAVPDASTPEVVTPPEDRPSADASDVAAPLDGPAEAAVDAGAIDVAPSLDAPATDAPATDAQDASARDVVDAPAPPLDAGPPRDCGVGFSDCNGACAFSYGAELHCGRCGNACATGNICIRGMCGAPTRFVGAVTFGAMEYARDANAVIRWDALCAGRYGSSAKVCTSYEVPRSGEGERACAAIGDPDGGIRQAALAMPPPFLVARGDGSFAFFALVCRGAMADSRGAWDGPTVAACCAP